MIKKSTVEALEAYTNGNISGFKEWLEKASKIEIIEAIQHHGNWERNDCYELVHDIKIYLEDIEREKEIKVEQKQNWYFTFGVDHTPHHKSYVKIYGTCNETREKMFEHFGKRWCMQYKTIEETKYDKYGLSELVITQES